MALAFNERAHRYRLDDEFVPSVTAVINGGLPKPALPRWAARLVAEHIADNPEPVASMLARMGREPLIAALAALPDEAKNVAGVRGTNVHALAAEVVAGTGVTPPPALAQRVEGYARWLDLFRPDPILTERQCGNRADWYAGTFDLIARLGGAVWLLDLKTSRGVYGDVSLQCAAYARTEFYVADDGAELDMPHIDRIGVVHVTDDGTDLFDLGDIDAAYREFLGAKIVYLGNNRRSKLIGAPERPPVPVLDWSVGS